MESMNSGSGSKPPAMPPPLPKPKKPLSQIPAVQLTIAIIFGLAITCSWFGVQSWNKARLAQIAAKAAEQKPHDEVLAKIALIQNQGKELPPCPLIFPLLDSTGKMNQAGTYLSYLAMSRATYLPQAVFCLPGAGGIFNRLRLFNPQPNFYSTNYLQELPFRFEARDFGEGTWSKKRKGYQVDLRFWGTRPEKKYTNKFGPQDLHLVPLWMASCLHDYIGFTPNPQQAEVLSHPIFTTDEDFLHGANSEWIYRSNSSLVLGWVPILAKNPENAFLNNRENSILCERNDPRFNDFAKSFFQKHPDDSNFLETYAHTLFGLKRYAESLDLFLGALVKDNNNSSLYEQAVDDLEKENYWAEAVQLLKTWTQIHPDNPEAWMDLSDAYVEWGWQARGTGTYDQVTPEGWASLEERGNQGILCAIRSTELAPKDCRTWSHLLRYGYTGKWNKDELYKLFHKSVDLNPYRDEAYTTLANLLQARWYGSDDEYNEFRNRYPDIYPLLFYDAATDAFFKDYISGNSPKDCAARRKKLIENVTQYPVWDSFQEKTRQYFQSHLLDTGKWTNYFYWCCLRGERDKSLEMAKSIIPNDPELQALYPYLVLEAIGQDEAGQASQADIQKLDFDPGTVALETQALKQLCALEPDNQCYLNRWASYCVKHQMKTEAQQAFVLIGDNFDPAVWNKKDFLDAKKSVE